MTTFQDLPPQSRRAARQSERAEAAQQGSFEQGDMWDTTARRAAMFTQTTPEQSGDGSPAPSGRRAAAPAGEPLDYVTQQKPAEAQRFRQRGSTPAPESESLPPTEAMPAVDQPAFRVRDYSPEGRRAAPPAPAPAPEWTQPYDPLTDLDYQTQGRAPEPVAQVPQTIQPEQTRVEVTPPPLVDSVPPAVAPERTLSRRELRAMMQASTGETSLVEDGPAPAGPALSDSAPDSEVAPGSSSAARDDLFPLVAPEPTPGPALSRALNEFDAFVASPPAPSEGASDVWQHEHGVPRPDESQAAAHQPEATAPVQPEQHDYSATSDQASPWTPPPGHWSTQVEDDDVFHTTIGRTVGSSSATTSALVLPIVPDNDIRGPLTGTGEIMLTGSIDLPQTLAATGASARLERSDIDFIFETHDAESVSTDSQPVSAIKAVSTQSGSGLHHAPKQKGTRALTALVISAAAMGVVVVGLLIVAVAVGAFS